MISLSTKIVMIGGTKRNFGTSQEEFSSDLLELSGDPFWEWKILEQKLQYPRYHHVSFSISNDIAANLTKIGSSVQN